MVLVVDQRNVAVLASVSVPVSANARRIVTKAADVETARAPGTVSTESEVVSVIVTMKTGTVRRTGIVIVTASVSTAAADTNVDDQVRLRQASYCVLFPDYTKYNVCQVILDTV